FEGVAQLFGIALGGRDDGPEQRRTQVVHGTPPNSETAAPRRSWNTRTHDIGRRRYNAESYASSGLTQSRQASCRKLRPTAASRQMSVNRTPDDEVRTTEQYVGRSIFVRSIAGTPHPAVSQSIANSSSPAAPWRTYAFLR